MKKSEQSEDSDLRAILQLLRISGLAPYRLDRNWQHSKVSNLLVTYSLFLAASIMCNMIVAEKDDRNNIDYPNKSFLIRISFDVVDVLENVYPCLVIIKCLVFTNVSSGVWFKIRRLNEKLRKLNVKFDDKKLAKYIYGNIAAFMALSVTFLALDIFLCSRLGIYYTFNYWLLCGLPLIQNSIVEVTYGGFILVLYQRFWAINELLIHSVLQSEDQRKEKMLKQPGSPIADKTLFLTEDVLLCRKYERKIRMPLASLLRKFRVWPLGNPASRTPFLVMMKNYGECFGSELKTRQRDVGFIRSLKILHFELFDVVNDLNSMFGWTLLFVFTASFFGCTINLYFVIIFHLKSYDIEQYVSCLSWMVAYLFKVLYFIAYSSKASHEAHRTTNLLHLILNNTDFSDTLFKVELRAFCLQLSQCKIQFKAAGFFTIDYAFLFQFVAGVLSNVVFVVQFDKINFSKK